MLAASFQPVRFTTSHLSRHVCLSKPHSFHYWLGKRLFLQPQDDPSVTPISSPWCTALTLGYPSPPGQHQHQHQPLFPSVQTWAAGCLRPAPESPLDHPHLQGIRGETPRFWWASQVCLSNSSDEVRMLNLCWSKWSHLGCHLGCHVGCRLCIEAKIF